MSLGTFLKSESDLYNLGIFDWASIKSVAPISEQRQEEVLVKVHELPRNSVDFGGGMGVDPAKRRRSGWNSRSAGNSLIRDWNEIQRQPTELLRATGLVRTCQAQLAGGAPKLPRLAWCIPASINVRHSRTRSHDWAAPHGVRFSASPPKGRRRSPFTPQKWEGDLCKYRSPSMQSARGI